MEGSTYDVVAAGLGDLGRLLARYHQVSHDVGVHGSDAALRELDRAHHALDAAKAWQVHTRVETVLVHLALDPDAPFASASGGRKRQTLLARALVRQPDILLLDEPTNHLDVEAVEWMEQFLIDRGTTLLFVTHDRAFLRRLATRIVELDRGRCSIGAPTTTSTSSARKSRSPAKSASGPSSTRSWRRKRCGFAPASRRAARGTRGACGRSKRCAPSAARAANARAR